MPNIIRLPYKLLLRISLRYENQHRKFTLIIVSQFTTADFILVLFAATSPFSRFSGFLKGYAAMKTKKKYKVTTELVSTRRKTLLSPK